MRLLACNPDTIGDLVLRQPLFRAVLDAGHALTLVVRASAAEVAALVAPGADVIVLPHEVYGDVDAQWPDFADVVARARDFAPDTLLVAAYQWTRFEERLAETLRADAAGLVVAGLNGHLYPGDPHAGHGPASTMRFDRVAPVDPAMPEAEKNAALAEIVGCPVASADPVLSPSADSTERARAALAERGLEPGGYWVACVTGTAHVPIKAWPTERWAATLAEWSRRHGRRFLFVGLPAERPEVERVRTLMGDAAASTEVWMEPDGSVEVLAALASLSRGYVGHDTGPMHVAAAVGRPVLAVFGGGHGLRFAPRATPSVALTVRVPCAGCGWACSFETSHCVKELDADRVLAAADDMEAGRATGREQRLQELPADVHWRMTAFAADLARERARVAGDYAAALNAPEVKNAHELARDRERHIDRANELDALLLAASARADEAAAALAAMTSKAEGLVTQVEDRERAAEEHRALALAADERTKVVTEARWREAEQHRAAANTLGAERDALSRQVAELEAKLAATAAPEQAAPQPPARVRRTWREFLVDLACGRRHYEPRHVPPPLPTICVVVRVRPGDADDDVRRTVDSVLAEQYPRLQLAIAADDVDRPAVKAYAERWAKVVPLGEKPFAGVAEVLATTQADVVCWLDVGMSYEAGALARAGEYFRDHSLAMAAAFDQNVEFFGWRQPGSLRRFDVNHLRQVARVVPESTLRDHVFYRRVAYQLLGPLKPVAGHAAGWDLLIRFSRRFGVRRVVGDSVCDWGYRWVRPYPEGSASEWTSDFEAARAAFEATFGPIGRARCGLIALVERLRSRGGSARAWSRKRYLHGHGNYSQGGANEDDSAAPVPAGSFPTVPLSNRRPDWLAFSSRDVSAGEGDIHRAYYDAADDCAVAFPPVDMAALTALHEKRRATSESADPEGVVSPRRLRIGPAWVRLLGRLPSPYWRLASQRPGDESPGGRAVSLVGPAVAADPSVRALVVGCFDGKILDTLKLLTKWQLTGLETNAEAAEVARGKGYAVWPCAPQDAFMKLPDGTMFDLIVVPNMLEHWDDPPRVVRRLVRLLTPTGRLVVRTPNLDSRLLELFGPMWWHWQLPHHRTLFGRRGLRKLAAMCDLRVERLRTVTDAYTTAASVQLNAVGLAGVVPEGAAFGPEVSAEGARLAGWARMLWDWAGRGDEMWAVLRPL